MSVSTDFNLKVLPQGALLNISKEALASGRMPTLGEVLEILAAKGVRFGIDRVTLDTALLKQSVETDIVAALSKPPRAGRNGQARLLFQSEPQGPAIGKEGKADFRELKGIIQIKTGEVLAVLEPPQDGEPGMDIFGKILPAQPGQAGVLPAGRNTRISEDGKSLLSTANGVLEFKDGLVHVETILKIRKDVDYSIGNVRFDGDVHIMGNVIEGFRVDAGGDLLVEGDVDGALILSRGGRVEVRGGVFGKSHGRIEAKTEVMLQMALQCTIHCHSLIVAKSIQDCHVVSNSIHADQPGCLVHGGQLTCFGKVVLADIGSDGSRTVLEIRDEQEEAFRTEKLRLEKEVARILPEVESMDRRLRTFKALIAKAGQGRVPEKTAAEMKAVVEAFGLLRRTLANLQSEKTMVENELRRAKPAVQTCAITGLVQGPVHLDMFHIRRLLDAGDSGKEFQVTPEGELTFRTAASKP